ncbi:ribosomal protection-like ABC-F family protein [Lysinibacillus odysseyi]|uniref:ABC transporter ATP-binding protein n=1 Tax=Lysinibacillus odysseyi 34hs-1 = NBRC 100172 TaxID=1220589 RepID=A0A0A3ILS3_9BACI|nr:ABC-F type ribosomal protection protein [Lysinibacillus odysseyi]KGR84410.1 ABC transporter ATP-binding protein [Lysinibacillus odysseyi 34hs-1 = NBRC 100172]
MQLKAENISKSIGGNQIFTKMNIEVLAGERIAVVGRNGCGKTTLFQLLAGVEQPDEGRVMKAKGDKVGYLHQIPDFPNKAVYEVLKEAFAELLQMQERLKEFEEQMTQEVTEKLLHQYGELQEQFMVRGGYEMDAKISSVANGLGIHPLVDSLFDDLSGGEKTKVMLAHIILQQPSILLLDEPTNHLDLAAIEWLENYIHYFKGTVIMISHDRQFLNNTAQKVFEMEDGEIWVSIGNYDAYLRNKELKIEQQFAAYQEQQKKIQKIKETIRRLRQWANEASPPNPDLYRKAKVMEKMLERMELVKKPKNEKAMNLQLQANHRAGKEVFELRDVMHGFGEEILFMDVNLPIYWQDRLAIVGNNGTGKSTLLKILLQQISPLSGYVRQGSNVKIGYLSQQFDIRNPSARLIDAFREDLSVAEGEARHILAQFLFYGHDVFKRVGDLSGGEKMRLRLAQLMYQHCNVLILDEPTNHLDIESREVLEETLEKFTGTIIAISHDRYFLQRIFTKTAWIENHSITVHNGPYNWAYEKQKKNWCE